MPELVRQHPCRQFVTIALLYHLQGHGRLPIPETHHFSSQQPRHHQQGHLYRQCASDDVENNATPEQTPSRHRRYEALGYPNFGMTTGGASVKPRISQNGPEDEGDGSSAKPNIPRNVWALMNGQERGQKIGPTFKCDSGLLRQA